MKFFSYALLLSICAASLCAETKLVLRKAGASASFEVPQMTIPAGERVILSTPIVSGDVWLKNGRPIPNALGPVFIIESASPRDNGRYRVTFISDEITESQEIQLTVLTVSGAAQGSRLQTFSTRGIAGAGNQSMVAGFVVSETPGQPTATKRLMVRAVGPSLEEYGVTGFLAHPRLSVYNQTGDLCLPAKVDALEIAQAHLKTGAFPLKVNSADVVLLLTLPAGAYTAQISAAEGSGLVVLDVTEIPPDL